MEKIQDYTGLQMKTSINLPMALGFRFLFILLMLYTILITAWVGDDIQIVFRQVWNFIHGDGITFNFGQRVQVFTHPLWFFALSLASYLTGELFLTTIVLCTILSTLAVFLLFRIESASFQNKLPVATPVCALAFSWAFVDYATSGLENALSYFLTGLLLYLLPKIHSGKNLKLMFLALALLVLNRFDYGILFLPFSLLLLFETKSLMGKLNAIWPGLLILLMWFLFATFYFGSPMPNTYYAKVHSDYPTDEILFRGGRYFLALRQDLISALIIVGGLLLSIASLNRFLIAITVGQMAYMVYIFQIGGDFMQGRFFALPVYLSMGQIILALACSNYWRTGYTKYFVSIFLVVAIGNGIFKGIPFMSGTDYQPRKNISRIHDERGEYYQKFGLFSRFRYNWPEIMNQSDSPPTEYRISSGYIGGLSLLDTSYHLIDTCALTDPFLSRLPAIRTGNWRIGHHIRKVPQEYGEFLVGNVEEIPDRKLNGLLKDVKMASKDPLFSTDRIGAILRLNSNHYTSEIDFSEYTDPDKFIPSTLVTETAYVDDWDNALTFENLPLVYDYKLQRFNNNIRFESKKPELADGIAFDTGPFYIYDVFVNGKKVPHIWTNEDLNEYKEFNFQALKFDQPTLVESVTLKAVGAKYKFSPSFNSISYLKLTMDNK